MKKVQTRTLIGPALDWAVAKSEDYEVHVGQRSHGVTAVLTFEPNQYGYFTPSTDWVQGGPIIDREKIEVRYQITDAEGGGYWFASNLFTDKYSYTGPTALIAVMRCYVAGKLGDEIEVPDELA